MTYAALDYNIVLSLLENITEHQRNGFDFIHIVRIDHYSEGMQPEFGDEGCDLRSPCLKHLHPYADRVENIVLPLLGTLAWTQSHK